MTTDNQNSMEEDVDEIMGLDEEAEEELIYLCSNDNNTFEIKKKCARISNLIDTIIVGDGEAGLNSENPISIKQVNGSNLELIVKYMEYHGGKDEDIPPQPVRSTDMVKVCKDTWDAEFCDRLVTTDSSGSVELNLLFEVIMSANYMDMKALLYKLCAKVATQLKGKKLEDIPNILKRKPLT